MTIEQAATYVAFALSVGAAYNSVFTPRLLIAVLRAEVKALRSRVKKLDGLEHEGD